MLDSELGTLGHLNNLQACREVATWSEGGTAQDHDGVLLVATGSTFPVLANLAFRTDDDVSGTSVIDAARHFFGERDRGFTLLVREQPDESDLEAAAVEAGLALFMDHYPEMICRTRLEDRDPPGGVVLRRATTVTDIEDMFAVILDAYPSLGFPADELALAFALPHRLLRPHIAIVNAYADGQAVGTAMTVLSHGVAGVYWVATRGSARGRGIGESVTRAVTNYGFDNGARVQSLQPSTMGEPIYLRMGYEEVFNYRMYVQFA
jgi:ribosomal protein S18 acetylase RimI-like enzyme